MSPVASVSFNDNTKPAPWLSFGTVYVNEPSEVFDTVRNAIAAGIRNFDCAQLYLTEKELGQIVRESGIPREDFWLTTKISNPFGKEPMRTDPPNVTESIPVSDVRASVLASLERLGTQPDVFFIHNPTVIPDGQLKPFWQVLEKMKDDGELTASLAVSNFTPVEFKELFSFAKFKPVINQIEYHPYLLDNNKPLLDLQEAYGIRTMAYGPLTPLLRHPSKGGPLVPVLERIASRLGIDVSSALLLWFKAKQIIPVTSSLRAERIANMGELAQRADDLTDDEVAEIDALGKKIHFRYYVEHFTKYPGSDLPVDI